MVLKCYTLANEICRLYSRSFAIESADFAGLADCISVLPQRDLGDAPTEGIFETYEREF